ncbi:hypothetical protein [Arthrobacter glacialis]|uniref:hypothetical protein n=1 Tax=Arthrobacter glacialis TaxID=1664 RepID=UPI000CD43AF6|nr:hypothetical protein [Arthrobacter glacialis]POH57830.1 hypothetical protein CVS28_13750 [Arthrobacter glacialis]
MNQRRRHRLACAACHGCSLATQAAGHWRATFIAAGTGIPIIGSCQSGGAAHAALGHRAAADVSASPAAAAATGDGNQ